LLITFFESGILGLKIRRKGVDAQAAWRKWGGKLRHTCKYRFTPHLRQAAPDHFRFKINSLPLLYSDRLSNFAVPKSKFL